MKTPLLIIVIIILSLSNVLSLLRAHDAEKREARWKQQSYDLLNQMTRTTEFLKSHTGHQ